MIRNALVLFFICAAVFFVFYLPSYLKMQDLHERNQAYAKKIGDLERENTRLVEERDRLENDPAYFEKMAREKMGLIRENEVVYKVVPAGTLKPAATEPAPAVKKTAAPAAKAPVKPAATSQAAKKTSSPKTKTSATMSQSSGTQKSSKTAATKKTSSTAAQKSTTTAVKKKSSTTSTSKVTTNSTK